MYDFKQTRKVIDGVKYSVTSSEGEKTFQVRVCKDDVTIELYIQSKHKQTCIHHRDCGKEYGMPPCGETMNTAHDLYEQFSAKLLA